MARPAVLVITGYGINCDEETRYAFDKAGGRAQIVHINDIISDPSSLDRYQICVFPGGFSYGDDLGSGRALANRIKNNLSAEFKSFLERDVLMLGICNGFQVMVHLGIVPAMNGFLGEAQVSLEHNITSQYECRWVDLKIEKGSPCVFTRGIELLHVPVAHGEGNFYADPAMLKELEKENLAVMRYVKPNGTQAGGEFPYNPNGSLNDIAAICDRTGRVMGMMPHPERNIIFTQRDDWTYQKEKIRREGGRIPEDSDGIAIFRNAVRYFG